MHSSFPINTTPLGSAKTLGFILAQSGWFPNPVYSSKRDRNSNEHADPNFSINTNFHFSYSPYTLSLDDHLTTTPNIAQVRRDLNTR